MYSALKNRLGLASSQAPMEPETASKSAEQLRAQIAGAEEELKALRAQLARVEAAGEGSKGNAEGPLPAPERLSPARRKTGVPRGAIEDGEAAAWTWPLQQEEYERYGRQLVLPQVGITGTATAPAIAFFPLAACLPLIRSMYMLADETPGQQRLKASRVLVIGAGGLGCPAAAYLAGAGVGTLGVVDGDVVEASNLHRQIAHSAARLGVSKVTSLVAYCKEYAPVTVPLFFSVSVARC